MSKSIPRSFRFARSVGIGLIGQSVSLVITFLSIPILMRALGTETYGLYILLHTATSYALLTTLGVGMATVRYTSEFNASGDVHALRQSAAYSLLFYSAAAAVSLASAWIFAPRVATDVLRLSGPTAADAVYIVRAAGVAAAAWAFSDLAQSLLQGLQFFAWQAVLATAQNVVFLVAAVALVRSGRGLRAIAAWYAAWQILLAAVSSLLAWSRLREALGAGHRTFHPKTFARFALGGGFGRFAWIVVTQLDKVYVARASSLTDTTLYAIPSGLLQRLQILRGVVANVVIPMMAELQGRTAQEDLRRIYLKSVRFILWCTLPGLVFLFALMPQILGLWLGVSFTGKAVWPARVLVLLQLIYFLEGQAQMVIVSRDHPWRTNALIWLQAAACVLTWKLLIGRWGLLGVAVGSTFSQALVTLIAIEFAHRRLLALSWKDFARYGLLGPGFSAALTLGALWPVREYVTTWPRTALAVFGVSAAFYTAAYALMSGEDRALLKSAARRVYAAAR